jgi:hypothetical protein
VIRSRSQSDYFGWRIPVCAAILAFTSITALAVSVNYTTAFFLCLLVIPIGLFVSVCALLMPVADRRYRFAFSMLCIFPALIGGSDVGLRVGVANKSNVRWLFQAKRYKTEVLKQPVLEDGMLRHVEWDGWGFAGSDTTEYLVYDPSDSLPHRTTSPGRFKGIPCEVPDVKRMDTHWYIVLFYTDQAWNYCGE